MRRDPISLRDRQALAGLELKAATVGLSFAERVAFEAFVMRLEVIRAHADRQAQR